MSLPKILCELDKENKYINRNGFLPGKNGFRKDFDVSKHSLDISGISSFSLLLFEAVQGKVGDWELWLSNCV